MTSKNKLIAKIYIFIFGLFSNLRITLIGQMPVSELLAVTNSLSINYWKGIFKNPDLKKINIAYFIFFLAQVVSDFANKSSFDNSIRGWANILVAILVLNFFYTYFNRHKSYIIIFLLGQLISLAIFTPDTFGTSIYEMSFFKFRVTPVLNNIILVISYYVLVSKSVRSIYVTLLLFSIYGIICIALDSRSNGLLIVLTGIIYYYRNSYVRIKKTQLIRNLILFLIIFQGLYMAYVYNVNNGNIGGEHAKLQIERLDNPYNPFSMLGTGRSEVLVALYAIADKPIFGHGSWAPDKGGKYTALLFDKHKHSENFSYFYESTGQLLIPSHSILFGAWMTAGLVGFLCMATIFLIFVKRTFQLFKNPLVTNSAMFPILILFSLSILWNMFFSPLPHIRQTLPFQLALILVVNRKSMIYSIYEKVNKETLKKNVLNDYKT